MASEKLSHSTVYEDAKRIAVRLPYTPELRTYHSNGDFPLIEDVKKTKKALIIGMFVLRPAKTAWTASDSELASTLHDVPGWAFNVKGLDGGWLIANGNVVDAYRLALQYGASDAVMVGSTTVAKEGVSTLKKQGYLWQLYGPCSWPHVKTADPSLYEKIMRQREAWQKLGYLSTRKWPAQIVITGSGTVKPGDNDILSARIFTEKHPDGSPIEAYILTSEDGAKRLKERAAGFGLAHRIDDIIIALSPTDEPSKLDISRVPQVLYNPPYNMKLINHDGGQTILSEFSKAGALPQLNLTLTRGKSLYEVLKNAPVDGFHIKENAERDSALFEFDKRAQYFFPSTDGKIPRSLAASSVISDWPREVAVVTFDARKFNGL